MPASPKKAQEFNPTKRGVWTNELYLIRRTIAKCIRGNASHLNGSVLDYGCGSMPYKPLFEASRYVGVDIAVSGHPDQNKCADFFFDGINLPFGDGEFDGVLMAEVLEHVFNPVRSLEEILRVLKPGGKLLLTCPFVWPLHEKPYDFARYTPYALRKILGDAGFEGIEVSKHGTEIEALAQIFIVEIAGPILAGLPLPSFLRWRLRAGCLGVITLTARFLSRWPRNERDFYLTNLVIAEKMAPAAR